MFNNLVKQDCKDLPKKDQGLGFEYFDYFLIISVLNENRFLFAFVSSRAGFFTEGSF